MSTLAPHTTPIHTDWLRDRSLATPDRVALLIDNRSWTFRNLDEMTDQMASYLLTFNRPENGRIGVCMRNSLTYVMLIHAAARLNLTLVTFNTRLTESELAYQIDTTACQLIFTETEFEGRVQEAATAVVLSPEFENDPLVQQAPQIDIPNQPGDLETIQAIVFTSGTSGRPKAVPIRFGQHFYSAMGSAYRLGLRPDDLWLSVLPLYHVGGLAVVFRSTLYGSAYDLHSRFDLSQINHALDNQPVTLISVVPTMLYRLIQTRNGWPASLRLILVGGAAATPELVNQSNRLNPEGYRQITATTYGMTEVASQFATQTPEATAQKPGSVGKPFLFNQLKLVDHAGQPVKIGEYGEILIKGPSLMRGYLNNAQANQDRFINGWFKTGDIGYLDPDGDLWIVQRRTDLIVSGGENVYPAEVEQLLRSHPAVYEAVVVGVPDPEWGQKVTAMIEPAPGQSVTEDALNELCRAKLAGYKRPRHFKIVPQLPQTASGKIERKTVAEQMKNDFGA